MKFWFVWLLFLIVECIICINVIPVGVMAVRDLSWYETRGLAMDTIIGWVWYKKVLLLVVLAGIAFFSVRHIPYEKLL